MGRLPNRVKVEATVASCTMCQMPIRMSKSNTDARLHVENKHPTAAFATCFPGQFDPTAPGAIVAAEPAAVAAAPVAAPAPKVVKKSADLSFLDDALASNPAKGKAKK